MQLVPSPHPPSAHSEDRSGGGGGGGGGRPSVGVASTALPNQTVTPCDGRTG